MKTLFRKNKGDKKSLLPRRFFGKRPERSDTVTGRSSLFGRKKKDETTSTAEKTEEEVLPEIMLEPPCDDPKLNVTILTQEETPPVTPSSKFGDEGSISDTISDLSASVIPMGACLPESKPPEPSEQKLTMAAGSSNQGGSQAVGSATSAFHSHRGATEPTGASNGSKESKTSTFSIMDMVDSTCIMPWTKSTTTTDDAAASPDGKDSVGPSWGVAPSEDEDEGNARNNVEDGGPSLDGDTLPSVGDTLPSVGDTLPSDAAGGTQPSGMGAMISSIAEEPTATYGSEDDSDDDESEQEEGYELVLDSITDDPNSSKKSKSAVWKLMKLANTRSATPPVKEEEKDEKYRAVFGADPTEPDHVMNKRTNSFLARLSNSRSKTPESKMTDESRNEKDAYQDDSGQQEPQMISMAKEALKPDDLVDEEGEREDLETRQDNNVPGMTATQEKASVVSEQPKKETISPTTLPRSRSWSLASALKRSISGDPSKKPASDGGTREDMGGSPALGLLNVLSGSPKKADKPKSESSRPPKPESPRPPKPESSRSPKPVWKAAVDPNTGATYYYHRLTRKTTWTKPPDFDEQRVSATGGSGRSLSAEQQRKKEEGVEVPAIRGNVASILRNNSSSARSDGSPRCYTKKQEQIKELLLDMSPPDPASVDKIIDEYRGREDELIDQLNEIVDSQPFDEPISKGDKSDPDGGEGEMKKSGSFRLPLSTRNRSLKNRVMTASSNFTGRSNTTGRSNFSGNSRQTLKTGNTAAARNSTRLYPVNSDISRSSIDRTPKSPGADQGKPPLPSKKSEPKNSSPVKVVNAPSPHEPEKIRGKSARKQEEQPPSPVNAIKAPRNRELLVEEFSNNSRFGLRAEKYSGKVVHGRRRPFRDQKPYAARQESPDKETGDEQASEMDESFATDSVSGLSASDAGFNTRKDEFDSAARSALDDAIRNGDCELAATVTDEMRGGNFHAAAQSDDDTPQEWTQSSVDKFISDNDWDAVARYIASMRDSNARKDPEVAHPPSNNSGGKARKRFGARSQLQHDLQQNELEQSSSWDSGTSFGSEFYSTGSSETPMDNSPRRMPRDSRKNFAC